MSGSKCEKKRACWKDPERTTTLVSLLQEQVNRGKRADSGFKKEAWVEVLLSLTVVFRKLMMLRS